MSKYQWPGDKIGVREMKILYEKKKQTGTPINELVRKAVLRYRISKKGVKNGESSKD